MPPEEDKLYLERRISEELLRAQTAISPGAIKAHYLMLGYYLDQLYGDQQPSVGQLRPATAIH